MQHRFSVLAIAGIMTVSGAAFAASSGTAVYTAAQAKRGASVYAGQCASCHGANLQGNIGPALKGTQFQQMAAAQQLTGKSLLEVISKSMPKTSPGSLSADQYDDVTAHILQQNGYPAGTNKLSTNSQQLEALKLSQPSTNTK